MSDFYPTDLDNHWAFVRGPARLLAAPANQAYPSSISDIIVTASGVTQYNAQAGWSDLGATKTGVQISINHAEETFDVDQILGDIESQPTSWECSVQTALAENTLEHFQLAWEGSDISTNAVPTPDERQMGYGQPTRYTRRRLAVLYKSDEDLIRAFVFNRVQLQPVESAITFNKTGEQISIPVQFKGLADTSVADVKKRFFTIFEQVGT
jgi:hypothetical protein